MARGMTSYGEGNNGARSDEPLADTDWFTTLEAAAAVLAPGERYHILARRYFPAISGEPPMERLVSQSLLVRIHGLHRGIWLGLVDDNPWQVWPLMRAMFELEVVMLFIAQAPHYLDALSARPSLERRDHPVLPSMAKMLHRVRDEIPPGVRAYEELSDVTHAGPRATWMAHEVQHADDALVPTWSSQPRFRAEQVPIAASQLRELIDGCTLAFERLATAVRLVEVGAPGEAL